MNRVEPRVLRFSVRDTGIGITDEQKKKLFSEFSKIETAQTDILNPKGVGLGLVISNTLAKSLAPKHKPQGLEITSNYPDKGAEFFFHIHDYSTAPIESIHHLASLNSLLPYSKAEEDQLFSNPPSFQKKASLNRPESSMNSKIAPPSSHSYEQSDCAIENEGTTGFDFFSVPTKLHFRSDSKAAEKASSIKDSLVKQTTGGSKSEEKASGGGRKGGGSGGEAKTINSAVNSV